VEIEDYKKIIVKIVQEYEEKEGISKHSVAIKITSDKKIGGSRKTIWKAFKELFEERQIELKRYKKQQFRLFTTDSKKKIQEFENKIKTVKKLLKMIDDSPEVGDCFEISKKDKIPKLTKYYQRELNLWERLIGYTINYHPTDNPPKAYCLQARYDLLRSLPIFLVNYVNDSTNGFSKLVKDEAMKIIQPILFDCVSKIQNGYSQSLYYSDKFKESHQKIIKISMVKGNPINDISAEFLRVLGRYYFSISHKFSKKHKIDSCKEQKIISEFVKSFYQKSNISNDKFSEKLTVNLIKKYFLTIENLDKRIFTQGILKRIHEAEETIAWKFGKRYERYANNDPFVIADYYKEWVFLLGIFSPLEKRIFEAFAKDSEEYEQESKYMDHDDPHEEVDYEKWKDFKGKLVKLSNGRPAILPNKEYSEVEPYVNRWTRILIEEN